MLPVYRAIIDCLSAEIGQPITLQEGSADYHEVPDTDLMFICGLPYVRRSEVIEAVAAPVLIGERYAGKPIYFSDVIVRYDSPYHAFEDLRGKRWAFNEPESQSGYGITRYTLLQRNLTNGFFGQVIQAGFHQKAIRMVIQGGADAAAIDSHVLSLECARHPHLAGQLRVIDSFGPSTIQPVAVNRRLTDGLKQDIQQCFAKLHITLGDVLTQGLTSQYVLVGDSDYDDIRAMLEACQRANFLTLR
jgi:phosphonate transport system substrate-binding protein